MVGDDLFGALSLIERRLRAWMSSWIAFAAASPRRSAATRSAPSIPAVSPAANTSFPSVTTRSSTAVAPKYFRNCTDAQWVVAASP